MSRKKNQPFASPFGKLKGLRLSEPAGAKERTKSAAIPPPEEEDADFFALEMARLGIERPGIRPSEKANADVPPKSGEEPPADDSELFLEALGKLDVTFRDELPAEEAPAAVPRRMKLVRQGKLAPEASLDLHGLTRLQAVEKVRFFLDDALWQGRRTVLVITGRGSGSVDGPVLRTIVEQFLSGEGGAWISEWGRAPARYGGEGALVLFLRERKK